MMDAQAFFNVAIAIICGGGGWWLNTLWSSMRELQKADRELADKVGRIEVLVAGQYVTRDEFQAEMRVLFSKLDKIADAVSKKADR